MDKKTLYEKTEKALNKAFDAAKQSAKVFSEKAGEAAHITKLLIEKVTLEHRVSKKFADIGNRVCERVLREGKNIFPDDKDLNRLIDETKQLEAELAQVEALLERERGPK